VRRDENLAFKPAFPDATDGRGNHALWTWAGERETESPGGVRHTFLRPATGATDAAAMRQFIMGFRMTQIRGDTCHCDRVGAEPDRSETRVNQVRLMSRFLAPARRLGAALRRWWPQWRTDPMTAYLAQSADRVDFEYRLRRWHESERNDRRWSR